MLDLNQTVSFLERLTVRNRQTNRPVPFRFNPSQQKIIRQASEHVRKKRRLFMIFLKARRLGVSTFARGLCQAHLIEKQYAEGLILAQQKVTARALYEEAHDLAKQLPLRPDAWKYTQSEINFWNVPSKLTYQTAGNIVGTRGLGFTFLHFSEAAYVQNSDVFPAVMSTLSDDPENMGVVETTPNGKEGPGEAYYKLWDASVNGDTEFLPIFLPWHDDPDYVRPARLAAGAPRDDYEKFLMRDLKLPLERIAFFRQTLHSKCGGSLDKWRRDYPGDPEEAFSVSGDPVFNFEDTSKVQKLCEQPTRAFKLAEFELSTDKKRVRPIPSRDGRFALFEDPQPGAHYFMGCVVGRGDRESDAEDYEDSLAAVVWNGETGAQAGRLHCPLRQESATQLVYALGRHYNDAMIACEDGGGGFGTRIYQELRDRWRYPKQYRWKGRNDKASTTNQPQSLGFTINDYTRKMILTAFLTALRRDEVAPLDQAFADQMSAAQWENAYRFESAAGFDDVLYAGLVGWIAKDQYHPNKCLSYASTQDGNIFEDALQRIRHQKSPFTTESGIVAMNLQSHLDQVKRRERNIDEGQ